MIATLVSHNWRFTFGAWLGKCFNEVFRVILHSVFTSILFIPTRNQMTINWLMTNIVTQEARDNTAITLACGVTSKLLNLKCIFTPLISAPFKRFILSSKTFAKVSPIPWQHLLVLLQDVTEISMANNHIAFSLHAHSFTRIDTVSYYILQMVKPTI